MAESLGKRLGVMLIDEGIITEEQFQEALQEQNAKGGRIETILVRQGHVTQDVIMAFVGTQLGIPHVNLNEIGEIPKEIVFSVPEALSIKHCFIPISKKENKITVAMADPLNVFAIEDIKMTTGFEVEPAIGGEAEIKALQSKYFGTEAGGSQDTSGAMQELINSMGNDSDLELLLEKEEEVDISKLEAAGISTPVIRLVNLLLTEGVRAGASDVHIEPYEKSLRCRYRIDGVLHEIQAPPLSLAPAIASRIKIMAKLDISERRLPQDGRIKITVLGKEIDLRVSICPMQFGEKVVMRILDSSNVSLDMAKLGFEEDILPKFIDAIDVPYGLVLLTGPTGSGKSTTLYSALNYLNDPVINITTIEDPVEYHMEGVNQVEAKSSIGLDFARGLRSFLRQSPDIIMVGEIRDKETAQIAIDAALTGLMVFSTLHTNDAPGAVTRLGNMGIGPFLISSTIHCVVAQRLIRKVCTECKEPYEATPQILEEMNVQPKDGETYTLYRGMGCSNCSNSGYRGRMAIHEVLIPNDEFRMGVIEHKSAVELKEIARNHGMQTLRECGVRKVLKGLTTIEELFRVAHADEEIE